MAVAPDFVPWMQSEVKQWADRYGCDERRAFPAWAFNFVLEVEDDDAYNQTDTLTQGDAGLDGWHFDRASGVFHLMQAKYLDDPIEGSVSPGQLDPLVKAALLLRSPADIEDGPHKEKLTTVALQLEAAKLDEASISLDVFVAGRVSSRGEALLRQAVGELGSEYSVSLYDTERLYELKLGEDLIQDLTGKEVRFVVSGPTESYERSDPGLAGVGKAAVAALDGRSLADAVDQWRARLFHGNVRYYLRRSNRVNKSMLATLSAVEGQKAFWLYNNGLTIVADSFSFQDHDGRRELVATNPQIVNGAQTSSVLRERRANLSFGDVSVQARIIAVSKDADGRAALERISEFTNSQSPVKASDLRANDLRHRQLQTAFGLLSPPVFYERRRGEWQSLDAASKGRYAGVRVDKSDVGQRYLAFTGRPSEAVTRKEEMFGGDLEASAFDPSVSAHVYMLAYDLYRQADALMKVSNNDNLIGLVPGFSHKVGDSDSPTQLEALRRAHKLVCSHATALSHDVLRWRYADVGARRAQELRSRISDSDGATYKFVWHYVFRSIRNWFSNLPDQAAIRWLLQQPATFQSMKAVLSDNLVNADRQTLSAM